MAKMLDGLDILELPICSSFAYAVFVAVCGTELFHLAPRSLEWNFKRIQEIVRRWED